MSRSFVDELDHRTRIHDRALRRLREELDVAADDVIEHDDAAAIADAAGIVRARDAYRAGRLLARARSALSCGISHVAPGPRSAPSAPSDTPGAHRCEHLVDRLRRKRRTRTRDSPACTSRGRTPPDTRLLRRRRRPSSVVWRCPMPSFSRKYAMMSSAPLIEHANPRQTCSMYFPTGRR